jgi:hypothetical protein
MPTSKRENCPTPGEKHTCNHWQESVKLGSIKFHSQYGSKRFLKLYAIAYFAKV